MFSKVMVAVSICFTASFAAIADDITDGQNGVSASEIIIGQTTALTGGTAPRTTKLFEGQNIYINKINSEGGVFGRKIHIITLDDAYDPKTASDNAKKLIEKQKVFMLFQASGTPTIKAIMPVLEKNDVPLLALASPARFFRVPAHRNLFPVKPGSFDEAEKMVSYLQSQRISDIGIFYQDDAFGEDGKAGVAFALARRNLKVTATAVYQRNSTDVSKAYQTLKKAAPRAVIVWSVGKAGVDFMELVSQGNWAPTFLFPSVQLSSDFLEMTKSLKHSLFVTMILPNLESSNLKITRDYVADAAAAGLKPDVNSFEGYVNARVLVETLRAAGQKLSRLALRTALEDKMKNMDFGGLKCEFSHENHQAFSKVFLGKVTNGHVLPVDD